MNLPVFIESLQQSVPPDTSVYLQSLWYDAKDEWKRAHELIGDLEDKNAYIIHAYLHRKEGDIWNADYWYSRAGKKRPSFSLQKEWTELVTTFLDKKSE